MLAEFDIPKEEIDLTSYKNRNCSYTFNESDLVIIGIPIYGGRIPSVAEDRIKLMKGNNTPVVLVATYGNVHYSNAIFDLQQIVNANGFITVAAAVVVSEHNVVKGIATGRPNPHELVAISSFTKRVYEKIIFSNNFENIIIKGEMSSSPRDIMPIKPYSNKKCTYCGVCSKLCPTQAINDPRKIAGKTCIRCMRCIKYCPQNARTYGKPKEIVARLFLIIASHGEKQTEFFL